ncbi:MAG: hypothetical protein CM15mP71_0700 [Candidatus Poseidoniales archaeon]|nr:MAG: hypothetical protein CM15mP71_0700 [Candidatus Poseidoniales archaeon]
MADAAIAALNGQKIKGRRIGVRDADAQEMRSQNVHQDHKGPDSTWQSFPFKATEDDYQPCSRPL